MEPMELNTFLSQKNGSHVKDGVLLNKDKVQVVSRDAETGQTKRQDDKNFNPFLERDVKNPTTDGETLIHLLKASIGSGILSMPAAFANSGLVVGIIGTFLVAFICTHCAYIVVKCAHALYFKTRRTQMSFADVAEVALETGPQWSRKFSKILKYLIQIGLFVTYFGTLSVYTVIIMRNVQEVIKDYTANEMDLRLLISLLLIPLILLCWIPNLKYLAPVSLVANILMGISLGITFYYLVEKISENSDLSQIPLSASIGHFPSFFSITVFAIEAIGVIMPLENNMKTPQNFVGTFGVLNRGMFGVTLIYILMGCMGYSAYLGETEDSITLNLPEKQILAQIVKLSIGLAVFFTSGLQFFVCLEIAWNFIKHRFEGRRALIYNYVMRTVIIILAVLLAIVVPTIKSFVELIGAFCFSIIGLMIPAFMETITFWDQIGFRKGNWMVLKNVIIGIVGITALVAGTNQAVLGILKEYSMKK